MRVTNRTSGKGSIASDQHPITVNLGSEIATRIALAFSTSTALWRAAEAMQSYPAVRLFGRALQLAARVGLKSGAPDERALPRPPGESLAEPFYFLSGLTGVHYYW